LKDGREVAIVGLGLMGGSLARALTAAGYRVIGVDRPPVLRRARAARAIVQGTPRVEEVAGAPVIVLSAPPRTNLSLLRRLAHRIGPRTVVTDLGSVKSPICALAKDLGLSRFVGGHPMAGSERQGFRASTADLFRGHPWILTPDGCAPTALLAVRRLARAVGARPHAMRPDEHDRAIAFLSHVPQLVAWAIDGAARGDRVTARYRRLAGPGFRDMTRLARSPRRLWREILIENRREVVRALAVLARALQRPV